MWACAVSEGAKRKETSKKKIGRGVSPTAGVRKWPSLVALCGVGGIPPVGTGVGTGDGVESA
jgi:hypothetical protein